MRNLGLILLGLWLLATGLMTLLDISFSNSDVLLGLLAVAAGLLLLLERRRWRLSDELGKLLLSLWLIATGLIALLDISFSNQDVLMGLLAVAAGILLLLRR